MLEQLVRLFAPFCCLACERETDQLICRACVETIPRIPSRCYRCKAVSDGYATCRPCRRLTPLQIVIPVTFHRDLIKEYIHACKYERAQTALYDVAALLWHDDCFAPDAILVPVPTANARVRSRGYDHAVQLAQIVSMYTGRSSVQSLRRLGSAHQVGAGRRQRLKQLESAFYVSRPKMIRGRHIILIDDVLTTGATLETAARTLKKAGAASVSAIVLAQA